MNGRNALLVCGLLVGLTACQSPGNPGSRTASVASDAVSSYVDQNGMMPTGSSEYPHAIASSGDYQHVGSGLILPMRINGINRVDLNSYNGDDSDVSSNYRLDSERVGMTAYIFPVWTGQRQSRNVSEIPEICAAAFESMKGDLECRFKASHLLEEGPETNPRFPDAAVSRMAVYEVSGDRVSNNTIPACSEIHMSCGVGKIWIVQYRISYAQGKDADAIRRDFMAAVPLVAAP
jgi:hypothetical protein